MSTWYRYSPNSYCACLNAIGYVYMLYDLKNAGMVYTVVSVYDGSLTWTVCQLIAVLSFPHTQGPSWIEYHTYLIPLISCVGYRAIQGYTIADKLVEPVSLESSSLFLLLFFILRHQINRRLIYLTVIAAICSWYRSCLPSLYVGDHKRSPYKRY